MSVSLRTIATATLAFALAVGLVTQTSVAQPASATAISATDAQVESDGAKPGEADTSESGSADTSSTDTNASANGDENSSGRQTATANGDSDAAAGSGSSNATGTQQNVPDPEEKDSSSEPETPEPVEKQGAKSPMPLADPKEIGDGALPRLPVSAAEAATSVSGFRADYIISDSNMYNGAAMTASQVQTFLNERMPKCTIGQKGREPGTPAVGSTVASNCLKDLKIKTQNRSANAYCAAYAGSSSETAAQVIAKVGKACNVSQRVLLVMLEKEQSLVAADTWPTVRQFETAMGYGCPDNGPNNSANCNSNYFGFGNQVFWAAWQLQDYKARPTRYNHAKGRSSYVAWTTKDQDRNPVDCGGTNINMKNHATAGLYNYTPYQPNSAALNAGWGVGDKCSSYGNRNFYLFYKAWFGTPNTFFPDVQQDHKFFKEIEWMGTSGLSTGVQTNDGRGALYNPKSKVTREAMAAFLYRLEKSNYKGPKVSPFKDVKPGDKFYNEITWMYDTKLSTGIKQPTGKPIYAPKDNVSREAMAAFIYRLKDANYQAPTSSPFADMNQGDKFYREITWMHHTKLSTGVKQPSGKPKYLPKDRVTREAMAAFIYRLKH